MPQMISQLNSTVSVMAKSFYSHELYRDVFRNWRGFSSPFLLLVVMLLLIPVICVWSWRIQQIDVKALLQSGTRSPNTLSLILSQLPEITIENGQASIEEPQPFNIYSSNKEHILGIIDTTGSTQSLDGTNAIFLITKNELLIVLETDQEIRYRFQPHQEKFIINKQTMGQIAEHFKSFSRWFLPLIAYPIFILSYTAYTLVQALFYAIIAVILFPLLKKRCNLKEGTRLAIVASIPALMVEMFFLLYPYYIKSHHNMIVFTLSLGYFLFACWSNTQPTTAPPQKKKK